MALQSCEFHKVVGLKNKSLKSVQNPSRRGQDIPTFSPYYELSLKNATSYNPTMQLKCR